MLKDDDGHLFGMLILHSTTNQGVNKAELVDGQQRMTSLYQYFKDSPDLKLPRDLQKYQNLPEDKQMEFLEYSVVVRDLGKMSIEAIKTIFKRKNNV